MINMKRMTATAFVSSGIAVRRALTKTRSLGIAVSERKGRSTRTARRMETFGIPGIEVSRPETTTTKSSQFQADLKYLMSYL